MIDFVQLLAVGLAALFFTSVTVFVSHSWGPWGNYWSSFVIMMLGIWAANGWIEPMGPVYGGVAWLPLILAGIYLSVLLLPFKQTDGGSQNLQKGGSKETANQAAPRRSGFLGPKRFVLGVAAGVWCHCGDRLLAGLTSLTIILTAIA